MKNDIQISQCKKRLAVTWLSGAGIIFLIILLQSILGRFGSQQQRPGVGFYQL